jgi:acetyl esterase/lipase
MMFFGGGWKLRCTPQMKPYWEYFSSQGYVVVVPDYRLANPDGPEKVETHCLPDVKASIRWVRKNASTLGINPDKIVGFGTSAGGHLPAAAAIIEGYEHGDEDLSISSKPNLLALLYPVMVVSPDAISGCGGCWDFFGGCFGNPDAMSPGSFVAAGDPPTLILVGANDYYLPGDNIFKANAKKAGVEVLMDPIAGAGHDFAMADATNGQGSEVVKERCMSFFASHAFGPENSIVSAIPGQYPAIRNTGFSTGKLASALYGRGTDGLQVDIWDIQGKTVGSKAGGKSMHGVAFSGRVPGRGAYIMTSVTGDAVSNIPFAVVR